MHHGNWNGHQIINREWIEQSTLCDFPINQDEYTNSFLGNMNIAYKYMWYSTPAQNEELDFFAWGKYNQILYISPSNSVVILRTGKSDGNVDSWPEVLKSIAARR
jgi:CubicO group peptidase (beta-lactamase class C family)